MKAIVIFLIFVYQFVISPFIHAITGSSSGCRYSPTCSEYTKAVLQKYGVKKGIPLALKRIASCHPFAK